MGLASYVQIVVPEYDLTTPTAAQGPYSLGYIHTVKDSDFPDEIKKFMYVKAHDTLVAYTPYTIVGANAGALPTIQTAAPATMASGATVCVPQVGFTSGYYGFVQIFGRCTAGLANETHVANDYLELLDAGESFVVDGTSGATVFSPKSVAVVLVTVTGKATTSVNLFSSYRTALISAT